MRNTDNPTQYRRELKGKILAIAMNEFVHRGIRAVKMDDIARQLSISKRTLYEVFTNKEELLFEVLKTVHLQWENEMKEFADDSRHNVMDIMMKFYQIQIDNQTRIPADFLIEADKFPRAMKYFQEQQKKHDSNALNFFKRGVAEGYFRDDIDYNLISKIRQGCMQVCMKNQIYQRYPIDYIFRNVIFVFLRGLCTQKGLSQLDNNLKD